MFSSHIQFLGMLETWKNKVSVLYVLDPMSSPQGEQQAFTSLLPGTENNIKT